MGEEPLAMFNRNIADPLKGSIGFIDFVARPLYLLMVSHYPSQPISRLLMRLNFHYFP